MKAVGLGGVQAFDASLGSPQIVETRVPYMTPAWKQAFAFAATRARALGLELAIASSPGWSETGGPWVAPSDGMKKLVWSSLDVEGGKRIVTVLPPVPITTGPYGTAQFVDALAAFGGGNPAAPPHAGGEIAVLAIPLVGRRIVPLNAVGQDGKTVDAAKLDDAREDTTVAIPRDGGAPSLTLTLSGLTTVRAATLFVPRALPLFGRAEFLPVLEAKTANGWRRVATIPLTNVPTTVSFDPIRARAFRVTFGPNDAPPHADLAPPAPGAIVGGIFPDASPTNRLEIATFALSGEPRIDRAEAKAGFSTASDYYALSAAPEVVGIAPTQVIDLTAKRRPDGTLDWVAPSGRWRILRLGWSLVGTTNHPAAPESTGLEVDKYDAAAVGRYLERYLSNYGGVIGQGSGVEALVTDSIEAGDANWTPEFVAQFKRLRGYDALPWMPAVTGTVIGSRSKSDAFLYDYRRTLADLLASSHYGTVAKVAHAHGLKVYGEALESGRPQLGDDLAMRRYTDVPMSAMWAFRKGESANPSLMGDDMGAASIAHVYGQNLVAAESFTASFSPWAFAPGDLRHIADLEFALGINRPVIHTSPMSPPDDKLPGLSLAIFGQYFNRHESWAGMARPWIDYLARSSFLLQQGHHAADVAIFTGEEAPLTQLYADGRMSQLPTSFGFDFVDAEALNDALRVEDATIVAKGGTRYRVLLLGGTSRHMTLATLRRVAVLARAGATIAGRPPTASPSLGDDPTAYAELVRSLWSGGSETKIGLGRMLLTDDAAATLATMGVTPDFQAGPPRGANTTLFQHRLLDDGGHVYFVDHRSPKAETVDARFRVIGLVPERWDAVTGSFNALSYRVEGDHTVVPLSFASGGSTFVVFRHRGAPTLTVAPPSVRAAGSIVGPWTVHFQPGRGAPAATTLPRLAPLEKSDTAGIRYFSGEATYSATFSASPTRGQLWLDLGKVGDIAEVRINGRLVGARWEAPYRYEIARAVRPGRNQIDVRVATTWVNRLIGDAQRGATKVTFVAAPTYRSDAPLRPSGLIGPVTLSLELPATMEKSQ